MKTHLQTIAVLSAFAGLLWIMSIKPVVGLIVIGIVVLGGGYLAMYSAVEDFKDFLRAWRETK